MNTAKKLDRPATPADEVEVTETQEKVDTLLTTREVAEELGTDPRTLRKFLRDDSTIENAGKGNRYEFRRNQLKSLKKGFTAWSKTRQAEAKAKAEKKATEDQVDPDIKVNSFSLEGMTVKQLRELADSRGVEVAAKAKKADIIDLLLDT